MTVDLPRYLQLADLLQRPELLRPPPAVLPRLAWEGRCTLLAAPEKGGKSTLVGQGVAALAHGQPFLGESLREAPVLWFALDEPLGDLVRRLDRFGARRNVCICQEVVGLHDLQFLLEATGARLLVADTLVEFFAGTVDAKEIYNPMAWQPVLKALRDLLQATGCAALLLHHTTRDGSRYADSRQLGAGVDAIVTMSEDPADEGVRKVDGRGRMIMEKFRVRYTLGKYELDEGAPTLEMRVYQAVTSNPGISANSIGERISARRFDVRSAISQLLTQHMIEDRGTARTRAYYATEFGQTNGSKSLRDKDGNHLEPESAIAPLSGEVTQVLTGQSGTLSGRTNTENGASGGWALKSPTPPRDAPGLDLNIPTPENNHGDAWEGDES